MKYTLSTLFCLLACFCNGFAQHGLISLPIRFEDKALYNFILEEGKAEKYSCGTGKDLIEIYTKAQFNDLVENFKLNNSNVSNWQITINWDTQMDDGAIMSIGPVYKNLNDTVLFYMSGEIIPKLNPITKQKLLNLIHKELQHKVVQESASPLPDSTYLRSVPINCNGDLYHIPTKNLFYLIALKRMGKIDLYTDSNFNKKLTSAAFEELTKQELSEEDVEAIYLKETLKDTLEKEQPPFNNPNEAFHIKKKIMAMGIKLKVDKGGAIIWTNFNEVEDYIKQFNDAQARYVLKKWNNYLDYFESDFCRKTGLALDNATKGF